MSWVRLSDSYVDHPKLVRLSDGGFRLWLEGLAFCRKHQTDGRIDAAALQGFRYLRPGRVTELTMAALWHVEAPDYVIHDYHDWNPSRAEEQQRRAGAQVRIQKWRRKGQEDTSHTPVGNGVGNTSRNALQSSPLPAVTNAVTRNAFVPDKERRGSGSSVFSGSSGSDLSDEVAARAGALLEAYRAWFTECRAGARLRLTASPVEWAKACDLCALWDDATLEKLARIFLTTDDDWISQTGREFSVFALKASWCDGRLREWETKQKALARA